MFIRPWHPGFLGLVWVADLLLLLLLIPLNADSRDMLIAAGLWLVPTALLGIVTWLWTTHARA